MNTIEATKIARELISTVVGKTADTISGCEKIDETWCVSLEVIETKARIQDNDLIASYKVIIDKTGEVVSYNRVTRYQRAHASHVVAP
jgi:hypothetical protein